MKILVYGAGAIGGYLGAILSAAGEDVTLVARGAQYDALSSRGIILEGPKSGRPDPIKVRVVRPGEEKPPYDLIFVTLKSHQLVPAAQHVRSLGGKDAMFVFPQNGIPWWYFDGIESRFKGTKLKTLDPEGVLSRTFESPTIIAGIAFKPSDLVEPGRIRLADSDADSLTIGEIDNRMTPRLQAIAKITSAAGWMGKPVEDIRKGKWTKLLSNAVWNTMGSLTQTNAKEASSFEPTAKLAVAMTREVMALADAVGCTLEIDAEVLVGNSTKRVSLPPSTLQDVRAGRSLELDAIINVLLEISALTGVATPNLSVIAACVNLLNQRITLDGVAIRPIKLQ
ncbi:MAG: 2-dehydropantoate 2-reductase [Burkholderiales bacterium]